VTVGEDRVADEADGWKEVMTKNKSAVVLSVPLVIHQCMNAVPLLCFVSL